MSLQDDWLKYVEDPNTFSYDHFAPLITDTGEPVILEKAFGALPNGQELIRRIKLIRSETEFTGLYHIPRRPYALTKPEMRPYADRYADSVAELLKNIGEHDAAKQVEFNQFEYIKRSQWKRSDPNNPLLLNDVFDFIGDEFSRALIAVGDYMFGLDEAVLFMTKVPEVTRFVLGALVDFPVDDEAAYELWKGGARIDFGEEKTYIILADDYEEPKVT